MTLNCKGQLIDLSSPKVMGILNVTPDSFYDGGNYQDEKSILAQVEQMISEGAAMIDLGAYSSRPGAQAIETSEELNRILPWTQLIIKHFPDVILSIDTFRSEVAAACLDEGAAIINDISAGLLDDQMLKTIAKYQVPYIMMHMKGTPQNMQQQTDYKDVLNDILYYFSERISAARNHLINDIIVDPGFGFSKTLEQNYELLSKMESMQIIGLPVLAGISRKSMIYKKLGTSADKALNGTTALNMVALEKGASILRVHDVAEAMECIQLHEALN